MAEDPAADEIRKKAHAARVLLNDVHGRAADDIARRNAEQLTMIDLVEQALLTFNGFERRMAAGSEQAARTNATLAQWTKVMVWVVAVQALAAIATVIVMVATASGRPSA